MTNKSNIIKKIHPTLIHKKILIDQKHFKVLMTGFDLIGIIAKEYFPDLDLASVIKYSKDYAVKFVKYKGLTLYISRMKRLRNLTIKYLAGDVLIDRSDVSLTVDNIPKVLGP